MSVFSLGMAPYLPPMVHSSCPPLRQFRSFESAFIFYVRKYDTDRRSRVLRTGNEISRPNEIMDSIKQNRIDIVVVESENLRKGASSGIYDLFHSKLGSIVRQEHLFKHLRDFPVLYGHPGKEEQLLLRVYSVGDGKKA